MNAPADSYLQNMQTTSLLYGGNNAFVESLYEDYLRDVNSVTQEWRSYFDKLQGVNATQDVAHSPIQRGFLELGKRQAETPVHADATRKQASVLQLINAHRFLGVRIADLDPLQRQAKPEVAELTASYYGLSDADMDATFFTGSLVGGARLTLREILQRLRRIYCHSVGAEYMYISSVAQKRWIQARLEGDAGMPHYSTDVKKRVLERLTAAEGLERYLHTKYVGQKRFSLEGGDTLIPLLDHLLQRAGEQGVKESVIGMAHRGRLNVLINTLGKLPKDLFAEFEGIHSEHLSSGDVKYHQGFSSDIATPGGAMHLTLAFNPSHLEIVNPVVEGSVRARQHRRRDLKGK
ncbi:MAG: 2-oxoglutarate dehydrogenase E1 component, partial [Pseudomonadota bacterium]